MVYVRGWGSVSDESPLLGREGKEPRGYEGIQGARRGRTEGNEKDGVGWDADREWGVRGRKKKEEDRG